jgi:hypothetical protein
LVKTFISATDIEQLADQGVRELIVDEDTVLTAVAREIAGQRGVKLVAPGAAQSARVPAAGASPASALTTTVSGKPRGCQHGPLSADGGSAAAGDAAGLGHAGSTDGRKAGSSSNPVVDELIGAVKKLTQGRRTQ